MKLLSNFVSQDKKGWVIKSREWETLRSACIAFEHKFNIRLWTVVEENCFETPVNLMTKDLHELLIPNGLEVKKLVEEWGNKE